MKGGPGGNSLDGEIPRDTKNVQRQVLAVHPQDLEEPGIFILGGSRPPYTRK